ncbi:MAG: right-handed parallel beta-helix repeat-containing protein, partial [Planctomycetes bacterium]|nr:right-handed parallel beta-helix repeat-containing protein [Planctomycetota bacterium]
MPGQRGKDLVMLRPACLLISIALFQTHVARAAEYYVAPGGNDAWTGRLAEPNAGKTDGPFATLQRARDEIRRLKDTGPLREPVTVRLRGGVYSVDRPIEFGPEDSGSEAAPISYVAYAGERPVISGGLPIRGWTKGEGLLWHTTVPAVTEGRWCFHQLFVDGNRRTRARTPNHGYLYTEGILAPFDRAKWYEPDIVAKRGFLYREGDLRPAELKIQPDALIVLYHSWTTSIHFITELNESERIVRLAPPSMWPIGYWWEYNTRYHIENMREALDAPGEWYLDRRTGELTYWPLPGEDLTKAEVIAPAIPQTLLAFRGQPAEKKYVEYLRFQGLSFQHTDCRLAPDMPLDQQGATERSAMVEAVGLRHAVFEDCQIAHAGENGLWLDSGCSDNTLRRCHVHDLGASAIFIGPRDYRDTPEMVVARNVVDNCFVHDGSHIFRGSQGIWIGRASYNEVTHNEISDFHHLGISIGHSWGYAPSSANHNVIAFNHVHHICNGYFSDGGGIYSLGISPGTVIRNNVVHDVLPTPLMPVGGCGIYLDEGSSEILVENNVAYNVGAAAFTQHYGKGNMVRNNIFAFAGRNPICCARPEEHLSYTFVGNIVLSDEGQATSDHFSPLRAKTEFQRNLYWDVSGKEPLFSGVTFAQWQATGRDRDSQVADPRFADAKRFDFRLLPDSPALKLGFQPIATSEVGLYGDPDWVAGPSRVERVPLVAPPPPPPAPPPRPFAEDFESADVGSQPIAFSYSVSDRPELIQVTEETAAHGKRSLKFTDADNLTYGWQPHLFHNFRPYEKGKVRFACDVLNSAEHPADFSLALRDYRPGAGEYREGPSITFRADGTIVAAGKELTRTPLGKWLRIELQLDLGTEDRAAATAYRLTVTPAGQPERVFDGIPHLHPTFGHLMWFG